MSDRMFSLFPDSRMSVRRRRDNPMILAPTQAIDLELLMLDKILNR